MGAAAKAVPRYSWLCVSLVATTIYVAVRWIKARRAEVDAGMAPGIGLGGTHLVRPQQSPMTQPLAHRRLGDRPPNVVLLHGLGASSSIWQPGCAAPGRGTALQVEQQPKGPIGGLDVLETLVHITLVHITRIIAHEIVVAEGPG